MWVMLCNSGRKWTASSPGPCDSGGKKSRSCFWGDTWAFWAQTDLWTSRVSRQTAETDLFSAAPSPPCCLLEVLCVWSHIHSYFWELVSLELQNPSCNSGTFLFILNHPWIFSNNLEGFITLVLWQRSLYYLLYCTYGATKNSIKKILDSMTWVSCSI